MAKNNNKQNAKADAKKVEIEKSQAKKADAKQADAKKDAKKADAKADAKKDAAKKQDPKKADAKKADKNKKPGLFERLKDYLHNVKLEMKRVTWPTKQEVWRMSLVVIIALIFFGLLFYAIDSILAPLMVQFGKLA